MADRQKIRELRWTAERALRYIRDNKPCDTLEADLGAAIESTSEYDIRDAEMADEIDPSGG